MARTVDAAPAPLHVRSVGGRLDRSAPDTRRASLEGRCPADVEVFAVAASRLLHIAVVIVSDLQPGSSRGGA